MLFILNRKCTTSQQSNQVLKQDVLQHDPQHHRPQAILRSLP